MGRIDPDKQQDIQQGVLARAAKEASTLQKSTNQKRRDSRAGPLPLVGKGGDSQSRIAFRLDLINRKDPSALERLVGKRDIVSVNFFERGLRAAKAVCRIKTLGNGGGPPDYATGFLATPNLLVTNNHVLPDAETASRSLAEFEYELDLNFVERRGRIFPLVPSEAFYSNAELDVTIVAISPMGHDGTPITDFGVLPLVPMSGKGLVGEHVSIIQHPEGGTKQVVVRENQIIALDPKKYPGLGSSFLHYTTDTEKGSSGAPVFNDQWDLVAIHHLAIVDRDKNGEPLNRRGEIWSPAEGEDFKLWIANEGIRVSALWNHIKSAALFDPDAARIMAMLAYEPRANHQPRTLATAAAPQNWQTLPNVPDAAAFESSHFTDPAFQASMGFKDDFIDGIRVPLPQPSPTFKGRLAKDKITRSTVLHYTHFSLAVNADRRLAAWTAVNISGVDLKSAKSPSWRKDDRLEASEQTLAEIYGQAPGKSLQIDRGHLVRRLDPVWGPQDVADRAGADTFHYTNAAPQEHVYNSEIWGNLEDFVLERADLRDHKVSVMTGPVLRPDDNFYGEGMKGGPWQIPWSFWKIVVFQRLDGTHSVTGFIVEQTARIAPLFEATRYNPYTVDEARVFQRPVSMIEDLTGLDFGPDLRIADRMGSVESTSSAAARPIRDKGDIAF
jgi:endonuclease G